jgi:formate dehydrogenase beta subunit
MSQTLAPGFNGTTAMTGADIGLPSQLDGHDIKAYISWNALIIKDNAVNVVSLVAAYMQEAAKLACGECGMGYNGVRLIADILDRLTQGQGSAADLELLQSLAAGVHENARCDFCRQAVKPVLDSLTTYNPAYQDAIRSQAALAKIDYITKVSSPCMEACPIHQDIPGYIELTRHRRYNEALELIRHTNCLPGTLGRTCVALCEKNCVRLDIDSPLAIRALKRVPADSGLTRQSKKDKGSKKDKVAIVGAGPAGLAAAERLAFRGYQVLVIDERAEVGGMATAGIPSYRLPRRVMHSEVDVIKAGGAQFMFSTRVPHAEDLMHNFKAVLVAAGAHQSKDAGIDNWNKDYEGLAEGGRFLREVNAGQTVAPKARVLVVGGGNTAIDCARTAVRLGSREVTVVYRRSRHEMPARAEEIEAAEKEGVKFHFLALPLRIIAEAGKVTGAECQRMELGEPDASGRRRPVAIPGSEFTLLADQVLTAIGEGSDLSFLPNGKVELTAWGSIKTDEYGRTNIPWLFAAGDCVSGPASIVEALAAGKRAADSLDRYLSKDKSPRSDETVNNALHQVALSRKRWGPKPVLAARQHPRELLVEDRVKCFDEVELCFAPDTASAEAGRCLRCYHVMLMVRS